MKCLQELNSIVCRSVVPFSTTTSSCSFIQLIPFNESFNDLFNLMHFEKITNENHLKPYDHHVEGNYALPPCMRYSPPTVLHRAVALFGDFVTQTVKPVLLWCACMYFSINPPDDVLSSSATGTARPRTSTGAHSTQSGRGAIAHNPSALAAVCACRARAVPIRTCSTSVAGERRCDIDLHRSLHLTLSTVISRCCCATV
jgi:hypothetical protein